MNYFAMFKLCLNKSFKTKQISKDNFYSYILEPFLTSIIFCYMNYKGDKSIVLILISVSIMILWSINIFESSYLIIDEKSFGTLSSILVSPFKTQFVLYSEVIINTVLNIPTIIVVFISGYIISPYTINISNIKYYLLAFLLCIIAISTIGLLIATLLIFTRSARGIMNIIGYPFYILSGIFISLDKIPVFFRWISYMLPTTHAFQIFNRIELGNYSSIWIDVFKCIIGVILFHIIISRVIIYTEKQIFVEGSLDVF